MICIARYSVYTIICSSSTHGVVEGVAQFIAQLRLADSESTILYYTMLYTGRAVHEHRADGR